MSEPLKSFEDLGSELHIRFVERATSGDVVCMRFKDPAESYAVWKDGPALKAKDGSGDAPEGSDDIPKGSDDILDVVLLSLAENRQDFAEWLEPAQDPDGAPPVYVKSRALELWWRPGRVMLKCDTEQVRELLDAVVEFSHYERELRRTEREIAASWNEVEQDKALAFDVTVTDLRESERTAARMARVFGRRIRHARTEPHLYAPDSRLPSVARKLGEDLREKARTEARSETVNSQLEVFEHIYEMASQRMGEYKAARQGHLMEWAIIWLLVAEALLMLVQTLFKAHS
jgi:hypothetical protein